MQPGRARFLGELIHLSNWRSRGQSGREMTRAGAKRRSNEIDSSIAAFSRSLAETDRLFDDSACDEEIDAMARAGDVIGERRRRLALRLLVIAVAACQAWGLVYLLSR